MRNNQTYIHNVKFWIVLLMLLQFGGVISVTPYSYIIEITTMLLCLTEFNEKIKICKEGLMFILFIFAIFAVSIFVTGCSADKYMSLSLRSVLAFFVVSIFRVEKKMLKDYLYHVLWLICYLEILNIFLCNLTPFLFYSYVSPDGYPVQTIGFIFNYMPAYRVNIMGMIPFYRNQGLYWEPGVCQVLMNILLYIILVERKDPYKRACLPIIVIISTLSTTGYLVMSYIILIRLSFGGKKISYRSKCISIILLPLLILGVGSNVSKKVNGENRESAALRLFDYAMAGEIVKAHPLFGIGLEPNKYLEMTERIEMSYYEDILIDTKRGNTNSILSVFMFFGIPVGVLFVYCLYKQKLFDYRKYYFIVIFLSLLSEPLYNSSFVLLHLISSFTSKTQDNNAKRLEPFISNKRKCQ